MVLRTRKYCYQTNATVWSSELYEYMWDSYTGIPKRHIAPRRIQVCWYGNTVYSDRDQNIRPIIIFSSPTRPSLLWIFGCDKTIRDTQKWSFKQTKNPPNKSTIASKKRLEQMTLLSHSEVTLKEMLGIYQPYEYSWMFLSNSTKYIWQLIKNIAAIVIHMVEIHIQAELIQANLGFR